VMLVRQQHTPPGSKGHSPAFTVLVSVFARRKHACDASPH